jgi:Tape measure protein
MASVDDRLVAMKFDNAAFESKIATTMGSLEKLKGHLNFDDAKSSMAGITSASDSFNLGGIASAVEGISGKFSAMGAVAFSVIQNITTRAIDMGLSVAKSLTVAPISSGFNNYETKMTAIQTVMAGTGESMTRVNDKLAELNSYSDKTVYHFKDMTDNIGKFTNAGVSLDDAVSSIQGIANVAAISGANTENASAAMYNFGQSLSQGSVKLMDWKSIENANMGTVDFKTHLMDSAVAVGTLTKSADGLYKTMDGSEVTTTNFNTTLEKQWLTSAALTGTLKEYADTTTDIGKKAFAAATEVKTFSQMMDGLKDAAATGWSKTSELLFGNLEQAKYLWTGVNSVIGNVISSSATARNKLLGDFNALGGHNEMLMALDNIFKGLTSILTPLHQAFRDVFPAMTAQRLFDLSVRLKELTAKLILTPAVAEKVRSVFKGIFAILNIGISIVKGVFHLFTGLLGLFGHFAGGGILDFFAGLGDKIFAFQQMLANSNVISGFFDMIVNAVGGLVSKVMPGIDKLIEIFKEFRAYFLLGLEGFDLSGRASGIKKFAMEVGLAFSRIKDNIATVIDYFTGGWNDVYENEGSGINLFADRFGVALFKIKEKVKEVIDYFVGGWEGMYTNEGTGIDLFADRVGTALGSIRDKLTQGFSDGWSGVFDTIKTKVMTGLQTILTSVKDFFGISSPSTVFFDIGSNIITGLGNGISAAFSALGTIFSSIFGFLGDVLKNVKLDDVMKVLNSGFIAAFLLIMNKIANAFKSFGKIGDSVSKAIDGVTGVFKAMQTNIKADAVRKIAISMLILAGSMVIIAAIDPVALGMALAAMGIGFTQLAIMMKTLDKVAKGPKDAAKIALLATGLILIAGAMFVLAVACKLFGTIDPLSLALGLTTITVLLVGLTKVVKPISQNSDGLIKAGVGIATIAASLLILWVAVELFGHMDDKVLTQGLISVALMLYMLKESVKSFSDNSEGMIKAGAGIFLIAMSLGKMADAVERFGKIDTKVLIQGMIAVGVALFILVEAIKGMPEDAAAKGAGILLLSIALNFLASAVERFGKMDLVTLAKGLVAMDIALATIAVALDEMPDGKELALQGLGLLLLSIALMAIAGVVKMLGNMSLESLIKGVGSLGIIMGGLAIAMDLMPDGKDLALQGLGLALVAVALGLLVAVVKSLASMSMGDLIKGLVGLAAVFLVIGLAGHFLEPVIPTLFAFGIAMVLIGGGMALFGLGAELLAKAFGILIKILVDNLSNLGEIFDFFIGILPKLAIAFAKAFVDVVKIVIAALPDIIKSLDKIVTAILQLIIDSIPKLFEVFTALLQTMLDVITVMVPKIIAAGLSLLLALLKGIADNIGQVVTLVGEIITNFLTALAAQLGPIITAGIALLVAFLKGIADNIGLVITAAVSIVTSLLQGIADNVSLIIAAAVGIVTSIIEALGGAAVDIIKAGKDFIINVITGMGQAEVEILAAVALMIVQFIDAVGTLADDIIQAGVAFIVKLIEGLGKGAVEIATALGTMITQFIQAVSDQATAVIAAGTTFIVKLIQGFGEAGAEILTAIVLLCVQFIAQVALAVTDITKAGVAFILAVLKAGADAALDILTGMAKILIAFLDGLADAIRDNIPKINAAALGVVSALLDGINIALKDKKSQDKVKDSAVALGETILGFITHPWDLLPGAPSKAMIRAGGFLVDGIAIGLDNNGRAIDSASNFSDGILTTIQSSLSKIPTVLEGMNEFNPTITPVLDLTNVLKGANQLGDILGSGTLTANLSYNQAASLAVATSSQGDTPVDNTSAGTRNITFEQTINSPTPLSAADIYRQTRSQIAMAKEELAVL